MNARANKVPPPEPRVPLIGLTGTIGSGKSTAAEILRQLGAVSIDADILARAVVEPGKAALRDIEAQFGSAVLDSAGALNRAALAKIIFNDARERKRLEAIVHPRIREEFLRLLPERLAQAEARGVPLVYEVPLLFESENTYPELWRTVTVWAPRALCLERIMRRDGLSRDEAEARLAAQLTPDEKRARADYSITNDRDLAGLRDATATLYGRICEDFLRETQRK